MEKIVCLVIISLFVGCKSRHRSKVTSVYGEDNRVETYTLRDTAIRKSIDASVMLIQRKNLTKVGSGYQIKSAPLHTKSASVSSGLGKEPEQLPLCQEGLAFSNQPSAGYCSGALVQIGSSTVIGSVGHCVTTGLDCDNTAVVFDYALNEDGDTPQTVPEKNVYFCRQVLTSQNTRSSDTKQFADYSLFTLDRPVAGRAPLTLSSAIPKIGETVYVIGHPLGIPQKFAKGTIQVVSDTAFGADFDALNGNSGSPVFDATTHQIFGFFAEGSNLSYEKAGSCAKVRACDANCGTWNMTNHLSQLATSPLSPTLMNTPTLLQASLARDGNIVRTTSLREGFRAPSLAAGAYKLRLTWLDITKPTTIKAETTGRATFIIDGHTSELKPGDIAKTDHTVEIKSTACQVINGQSQSKPIIQFTITETGSTDKLPQELAFLLPCPPQNELEDITLSPADELSVAEGKSEILQTLKPLCTTGNPCSCIVEQRKLWWGEVWRRTYPVTWSSSDGRSHLCEGFPRKYSDTREYFSQIVERGVGRSRGY